jgi:hypothetical protein
LALDLAWAGRPLPSPQQHHLQAKMAAIVDDLNRQMSYFNDKLTKPKRRTIG